MADKPKLATKALKMPKLPKSLGACVDLYKKWSIERLALNKEVEAYKAIENSIKEHIIDNVPKGDAGAVGSDYKGIVYTDTIYQVEDWDAFYKYLKANDAFDMLNRALNQAAVADRTEALNDKTIVANNKRKDGTPAKPWKMLPGVKQFTVVKLSVTKK